MRSGHLTGGSDTVTAAFGRYLATITGPIGVIDEVRNVFRDLLCSDGSPTGASVDIHLVGDDYRISVNGRRWAPGPGQSVYDQVIYVLMRASLDAEPDLLHVHAAYAALDGCGILIAGYPGSGKSTLVARLISAGFDYLTDERVGIDHARRLYPMSKPVSLVATSFRVVPGLDPHVTGAGVASPRLWHVPASAIRAGSVVHRADAAVLAFVEYRSGAAAEITEVHPAEAVRLLLSDSVDAARFGPGSVAVGAGLCASVHCVRVAFGDGDDVITVLRDLLTSAHRARPDPVTSLVSGAHTGQPVLRASPKASSHPRGGARVSPVPRIRPGVSGAVIRGRAVLHVAATGEIVELDEASTAWLLLVDGKASLERLSAEVATANDLPADRVVGLAVEVLGRLTQLGVLE